MKEEEYEMTEEYKKAAEFLVERIAERDEIAEQLKHLPTAARREGLRLLAQLDKTIEASEDALAKEYEATQALRRSEIAFDKSCDDLTESLAGAYVHCKYRHPEMIHKLDSVIDGMEEEHAVMFLQAIARHESGDLIGIIARQGETREQTEEFLRNFRAAEEAAQSKLNKKGED